MRFFNQLATMSPVQLVGFLLAGWITVILLADLPVRMYVRAVARFFTRETK